MNSSFFNMFVFVCCVGLLNLVQAKESQPMVFEAGHPSLQKWLLPDLVPSPDFNQLTFERAALGKQLFVDPRLSGTGQSTCIWCHTPERGWTDGMRKGVKFGGEVMAVTTPTLINVGYNQTFLWDGRVASLELEAITAQEKKSGMNARSQVDPEEVVERLKAVKGYRTAFDKAYPQLGLTRQTIGYAIASFERTLISNHSPFDQWIKGDKKAMTAQQINGFKLFVDEKKGNCVICHNAPNFTDDGFHNIGLKEFAGAHHHLGRYRFHAFKIMDGAFKTPTLRDVSLTAPYMHDGSLDTLEQVVAHYTKGGEVKTNLSPAMKKKLDLNEQEQADIVAFLQALTTIHPLFNYPSLPTSE